MCPRYWCRWRGPAAELPALLTLHKSVRLEGGDYTAACAHGHTCQNLTVGSGVSIYGLPGTRVPTVVVQPGSTGIMLSKLSIGGQLWFPPAPAKTSDCSFFHIHAPARHSASRASSSASRRSITHR